MKTDNKRRKLLELFLTFFKIGAFTFGGGYAMIPLMQRETVENKKWISDDDILEIIAIAESTPGPIAVNSATFIGYKTAGILGSVCATLGVVLPSFIVISVIARILSEFQNNDIVKYAFFGIRAGVLALVLKALLGMYKKCPKGKVSYIVMAFAFITAAILGVNILLIIIACALIGLISSIYIERGNK